MFFKAQIMIGSKYTYTIKEYILVQKGTEIIYSNPQAFFTTSSTALLTSFSMKILAKSRDKLNFTVKSLLIRYPMFSNWLSFGEDLAIKSNYCLE